MLAGVVRVTRGSSFTCVVNCTDSTVRMPVTANLLVASDQSVMTDGESLTLPPATGAWLSERN